MKHCVEIRFTVLHNVCHKIVDADLEPHEWEVRHNYTLHDMVQRRMGELAPQISRCRHLVGLDPLPLEE